MFRIRGWAVPKLRNFHSTSTEDGDKNREQDYTAYFQNAVMLA